MKKINTANAKENFIKLMHNKNFVYSAISAGVLVLTAAIVLIVLAATGVFSGPSIEVDLGEAGSSQSSDQTPPKEDDPSEPTVTISYANPLDEVVLLNGQGFYYNSSLNCYYELVGVDISAEVGSKVYSLDAGTVESIDSGDVLQGTQITVNHGDGLKSVYGFIDPVDGLEVGTKVQKGQVIATVASASGSEYKDGAHLHLEIYKNSALVDPADYLTLSEK